MTSPEFHDRRKQLDEDWNFRVEVLKAFSLFVRGKTEGSAAYVGIGSADGRSVVDEVWSDDQRALWRRVDHREYPFDGLLNDMIVGGIVPAPNPGAQVIALLSEKIGSEETS